MASVMFLDICGFGRLNEPQLRVFFNKIFPSLARICRAQGPQPLYLNTWGDAIVLAEQDPKRLLSKAADVRDFIRNFDYHENQLPDIECRISLHTGRHLKGKDAFSQKGIVHGTGMTLAARIEPLVQPNTMWATEDFIGTIRRIDKLRFKWRSVGVHQLHKNAGTEELFEVFRDHELPAATVAAVLVKKDNKVLIVKRVRRKDTELLQWQLPAGQVKPEENSRDAALRECLEETGVSCEITKKLGERLHPDTRIVMAYYAGSWKAGTASNNDPTENDAVEWVEPKEALRRFTTNVYQPLKEELEFLAST